MRPPFLHFAPSPLTAVTSADPSDGGPDPIGKPRGLWLSVGSAWLDWCRDEDFRLGRWRWATPVTVDTDRLLRVPTAESAADLTRQYRRADSPTPIPDWQRIAADGWAGVLFDPYDRMGLWGLSDGGTPPLWYYSVDVPSACVWDASAVLGLGTPQRVDSHATAP